MFRNFAQLLIENYVTLFWDFYTPSLPMREIFLLVFWRKLLTHQLKREKLFERFLKDRVAKFLQRQGFFTIFSSHFIKLKTLESLFSDKDFLLVEWRGNNRLLRSCNQMQQFSSQWSILSSTSGFIFSHVDNANQISTRRRCLRMHPWKLYLNFNHVKPYCFFVVSEQRQIL